MGHLRRATLASLPTHLRMPASAPVTLCLIKATPLPDFSPSQPWSYRPSPSCASSGAARLAPWTPWRTVSPSWCATPTGAAGRRQPAIPLLDFDTKITWVRKCGAPAIVTFAARLEGGRQMRLGDAEPASEQRLGQGIEQPAQAHQATDRRPNRPQSAASSPQSLTYRQPTPGVGLWPTRPTSRTVDPRLVMR